MVPLPPVEQRRSWRQVVKSPLSKRLSNLPNRCVPANLKATDLAVDALFVNGVYKSAIILSNPNRLYVYSLLLGYPTTISDLTLFCDLTHAEMVIAQ